MFYFSRHYILSFYFALFQWVVCVCAQSGHVQIFDLSSSTLLENVEAHSDSVTSIAMAPDKVKHFVSPSKLDNVTFCCNGCQQCGQDVHLRDSHAFWKSWKVLEFFLENCEDLESP